MPLANGGTGKEIIINEEPIDGKILGVVQADGSILPLPSLYSESQLGTEITSGIENESSLVGENFGEPIVSPEPGNIVIEPNNASSESANSDDAVVQTAVDDIAPSETPDEVVEARIKKNSIANEENNNVLRNGQAKNTLALKMRIKELTKALHEAETQLEEKSSELVESKNGDQQRLVKLREAENRLAEQEMALAKIKAENRKLTQQVNEQVEKAQAAVKAAKGALVRKSSCQKDGHGHARVRNNWPRARLVKT